MAECPGGDQLALNTADVTKRGLRFSCWKSTPPNSTFFNETHVAALGLTTKSTRASKHTDCYPLPGWHLTVATQNAQAAALCAGASYSPGFARLRACLPCQSGLGLDDTYAADQSKPKIDRLEVCKIPSGKYLEQNVVRKCTKGSYRVGQASTSEEAGRRCRPCPMGFTTFSAGSTAPLACYVGMAGFQLSNQIYNMAAADVNGFEPDPCPIGTYYGGGSNVMNLTGTATSCQPCPDGSTTQRNGSTTPADCMVPPGYFIAAASPSKTLKKCPGSLSHDGITEGFYREGWAQWDDVRVRDTVAADGASVCSPCGAGILSDETDISPGMGITVDTSRTCPSSWKGCQEVVPGLAFVFYKAAGCPKNTYGAAATTYGLYNCAQGYYSPGGDQEPCMKCPDGFTTDYDPAHPEYQELLTHCYVMAGHGMFDGTQVDPWGSAALSSATALAVECPQGRTSAGGNRTAPKVLCAACAAGFTTMNTRSNDTANCNSCIAGYGNTAAAPATATCDKCAFNYYQDRDISVNACTLCAATKFTYVNGVINETITSNGITFRQGSRSSQSCIAKKSQLPVDVGQSIAIPNSTVAWTPPAADVNMTGCLANCAASKCCIAQLTYDHSSATGSCTRLELNVELLATAAALYYKLLPSDAVAAFSVRGKVMSSGMYARCSLPALATEIANQIMNATSKIIGTGLGVPASFNSVEKCKAACDNMSTCWGFVFASNACVLRGGEDVRNVRTFFVAPGPVDVDVTTW
ncbi:hypothetical protein OEZ86_003604 [Tetradesmus obliquus]|nr:hypothetical protein OEZ86_003604 [Tetradesmus obliquus]